LTKKAEVCVINVYTLHFRNFSLLKMFLAPSTCSKTEQMYRSSASRIYSRNVQGCRPLWNTATEKTNRNGHWRK